MGKLKHASNIVATALAATLACVCAALPARAAAETNDEAGNCRGLNMLEELQTRNPVAFDKIEKAAAATANTGAVLWKIEKDGLAPSYLMGTVHLADKRISRLSSEVTRALNQSRTVLLEVADPSPTATAAALGKATRLALYANGKSLQKELTPEEFEKVRTTLEQAGLPPQTAEVFKPWIVTMMLSTTNCEREKVRAGALVLDMRIAQEAKKRGIDVVGLETLEGQLEALSSLPEDQQLAMLRAGLKYADRTNDLVETMIQVYLARKTGALWPFQLQLAAESGLTESSFQSFRENIIIKRNAKMEDTARPYLEKGAAFIAVGALHLSGEDGLVARFKKSGYTLTPVE